MSLVNKKFIMLILIAIAFLELKAQNKNGFSSFVELFKEPSSEFNLQKTRDIIIPENLLDYVVNKFEVYEFVEINAITLLNKNKNITLIVEVYGPQGGYSSNYYIINYNNKGDVLNYQHIGFNLMNYDGGFRCILNFYHKTLLEVIMKELNVDESSKYSYYIINDDGFEFLNVDSTSQKRKYPMVSTRIMREEELNAFDKAELDIMRNEIFADYGYIFKSDKWKKHFESQSWYKPRFNDVTDKLTIIEKVNIDNILKIAPLK